MQKDDLDGEIDLKSCVKVSEFNVEKNYGFQIQVRVYLCSLVRNATPFYEAIIMTQMYQNPL